MKLRIQSQQAELNTLYLTVSKISDDELKSHLVKYLCVRTAGFLENTVKNLVDEFHSKSCRRETMNFIQTEMKNETNLKDEKIGKLLGKFSNEWQSEFRNKISDRQSSSLNSLISNRNQIAHGNSHSVNITYSLLDQYYTDLKDLIRILSEIIKR